MIKKIIVLLVFVGMLTISDSYAAEIIFDSTQQSYSPGEIVELTGVIEGGIEGDLVAIEVKSPSGESIILRTVELGPGGTYSLKFRIPPSGESGSYEIATNVEVEQFQETDNSQEESQPTSNGGCLIATATYGSELAPQVQFLREIRDNTVIATQSGTSFMSAFNAFYYSFSPTVADLERQNPVFKEMVKVTITPLLSSLTLLQLVDIDSESEMLGYGIGIILLNIGMYFVGPAFIIIKLRSSFKK